MDASPVLETEAIAAGLHILGDRPDGLGRKAGDQRFAGVDFAQYDGAERDDVAVADRCSGSETNARADVVLLADG